MTGDAGTQFERRSVTDAEKANREGPTERPFTH